MLSADLLSLLAYPNYQFHIRMMFAGLCDAFGANGEGLQIDDGEIDYFKLGKLMNTHFKKATFIPEIWQGHKNEGEGFWIALKKLEKYFK